ncbi:MAG: VacJ family lipoprotein [Novosphingobium sp.]
MSVSALAIAALISAAPVTAVDAPRDLVVLNAASAAQMAQDTAPDRQAGDAPAADPGDGPPRIPYQDVSAAKSDQEILVTGEMEPTPGDPLERANAQTFKTVQAIDKAVVGPIAHQYTESVPKQARKGIHNVLSNLHEPVVFLNFLLQLKIGKAFETLGRFTLNSTVGVAGLIDVAKREPFNLPHRPNGLAYTLGYYGVGPGPYLVLPLIGSTTLRDVFGRVVDLSILPAVAGPPLSDPAVALGRGVISSIDDRARSDELIVRLRDESPDPYATMRDYYLQKRQAEIDVLRGKRDNAEISIDAILAPYLNGGLDAAPAEPPVVGSETAPGTDAPVSGEAAPAPAA